MKGEMFQPGVGITRTFGVSLTECSGTLEVSLSPGLKHYALVSAAGGDETVLGDVYGLLLETAPASGIEFGDGKILVHAPVSDPRAFEDLVLDELRGCFAIVTHTGLPRRLYPDCGGTVPFVYCPESRMAGSSASAIMDRREYEERFLPERYARLVLENSAPDRWISGTLTAHEGVKRLLCNHYLDLESWEASRFWPRHGEFSLGGSLGDTAELVARRLSESVQAAVNEHSTAMALTAGFDSRLLLAASRSVADQVFFFTLSPAQQGLDQIMSGEIAASLGLNHHLLPAIEATVAEAEAWDYAVGHTIHQANRSLHPSIQQIDQDLLLTGIAGESGRSRLYRSEGAAINDLTLSADQVLSRMGVVQDTDLLADTEKWLSEISWLPTCTILDLAILERFYMANWRPAQCAMRSEIMPFFDSKVQAAFLRLLPEEKGTEALFRACIELLWPETLDLPVNAFGDYRDHLSKAGKLLSPRRVAAFMRRRLM